jgi:two-component system sensor histidine kinase CpxA
VLSTESLAAGGLLVDFRPWLWGAAGLLVLSSLLWLPFVRGLTRNISMMKSATARIADGQFDVHVPDARRDELGELARGINRMTGRLSGFVSGQKRFLGDIAHELCTPLARMQMAGAALEQRAPADMKERIADLTAEIDAMSQLTGELLDFSRAGLAPQSVHLTAVPLRPLLEQVVAREGVAPELAILDVPANLSVSANSGLLARAIANVIRNALRHAGPQPKLEINAQQKGGEVLLTIADNGPGVPDPALASLFDPFFRLDPSRDRASGGTGLGLAIVKTCIETCGGTVTARNRPAGGLEVQFTVPAAAGR